MPGWNLKRGILTEEKVSEDEFWSLFNFVFSDACRKTNTYKFGLIKSICDQIYDLYEQGTGYFLSYGKLFSKFAENYWNLVNKYHLKQMSYNGKSEYSKIEIILMNAIEDNSIPENLVFQAIEEENRKKISEEVTIECKKCVIGALYNDFEGKLYAFDLKGEGIFLSHEAYNFISKYKMEIEKLNYYSWARFLEKVNDDDALVRVLEKLDLATPQRKDLSMYRDILYKEFQQNRCFYCGNPLNKNIHVDHFIPWTFVKNDNLWNFVLACPKCNIQKSNKLPATDYLIKIESRNDSMLHLASMKSRGKYEILEREFSSYNDGILRRMWTYAKMSGIKENIVV